MVMNWRYAHRRGSWWREFGPATSSPCPPNMSVSCSLMSYAAWHQQRGTKFGDTNDCNDFLMIGPCNTTLLRYHAFYYASASIVHRSSTTDLSQPTTRKSKESPYRVCVRSFHTMEAHGTFTVCLPCIRAGPNGYLCVSYDLLELILVLALVHVLLRRQVRRYLIRHDQVHLIGRMQ